MTSNDSLDVLISRPAMLRVDHVYSTKVPKEMKATSQVRCGVVPVSSVMGLTSRGAAAPRGYSSSLQKSSGRCWQFAALNSLRLAMQARDCSVLVVWHLA